MVVICDAAIIERNVLNATNMVILLALAPKSLSVAIVAMASVIFRRIAHSRTIQHVTNATKLAIGRVIALKRRMIVALATFRATSATALDIFPKIAQTLLKHAMAAVKAVI